MRAGILKHLVNVQMKTWDVGDRGQPINVVWTTLATVPVKIETLSGDKLVIARQLVPTATHEITMRFLDIPFGSGLTPFEYWIHQQSGLAELHTCPDGSGATTMSIDTDLCTKLATLTGLPTQQNKIDEETSQPFVFFTTLQGNVGLTLRGATTVATTDYTVEITGEDIDVIETKASVLRTLLHGFSGSMGGTQVKGMFVRDSADDYVPRSVLQTDEGLHVASFTARLIV
jgi:hypothetical protein